MRVMMMVRVFVYEWDKGIIKIITFLYFNSQ